jgi:hypothetical protein
VAVSHTRVSILRHAVPFAEELMLFSDQTQFVLRADGVLSPKNLRVDQATEFDCSDYCRPTGAGKAIYFPVDKTNFAAIKEYHATQDVANVKDALDITAHVPNYVPAGVFKIASSTTEDIIACLTEGAEQRLYIYKYLFNENARAQSSWSYWDFGKDSRVLNVEFIRSTLHVLVVRHGRLFLEKMVFSVKSTDWPVEPYRIHLDRKRQVQPEGEQLRLSAIFPEVPPAALQDYCAVSSTGQRLLPDADGVIALSEAEQGRTLFVGRKIAIRYRFSQFMIKQNNEVGGITTENEGRLQLRYGWLMVGNSGLFDVKVYPSVAGGQMFSYSHTGQVTGSHSAILGQIGLDTGKFRFPIMALNTNAIVVVETDEPTPLFINQAGWEGIYHRRSQRL